MQKTVGSTLANAVLFQQFVLPFTEFRPEGLVGSDRSGQFRQQHGFGIIFMDREKGHKNNMANIVYAKCKFIQEQAICVFLIDSIPSLDAKAVGPNNYNTVVFEAFTSLRQHLFSGFRFKIYENIHTPDNFYRR